MVPVECPTCGTKLPVDGSTAGPEARCAACGESISNPGVPPTPRKKSSSAFLIVMIVVGVCIAGCGIVAVIAAIAIPGLLRARIASNERNASASLKSLVTAEENFKSNDLDGNLVNDYWTADVAGLYCIEDIKTGNAIAALNDIGVASADLYQNGGGYANENVAYNSHFLLVSSPKTGYVYQALIKDPQGSAYAIDTDNSGFAVHSFGMFGFMAMPISWDSTGNHCFVVGEGASVFRLDFGTGTLGTVFGVQQLTFDGSTPCDYPSAARLSSDWGKIQ